MESNKGLATNNTLINVGVVFFRLSSSNDVDNESAKPTNPSA